MYTGEPRDWSEVASEYLELMPDAESIAVVTDTAEPGGGIGRVARNLAAEFSSRDKETKLIVMKDKVGNDDASKLQDKGVEIVEIERSNRVDPRELRRISGKLDELDVDWINTHGFYLSLAAIMSDTPIIKTYHAHVTVPSVILDSPLSWIRFVLQDAPSIWLAEERVSISKYAAKQMKRFYASSSHIIPNGVDTNRFQPMETDYREEIGVPEDAFLVGSLSALKKYKNQERTLEVFTEQHAHREDAYLVIGGSGPRRKHLEKKAEKLGIAEKTRLPGFIPDEKLPEFYNSLDLFIYPSKWEGFGLPPQEAKATGRSLIICSD
ncbi:MAG: glycosyltransferase family 4 protein [Candidatus Aenigmatarchaeota archaeon]